MWKSLFGDVSFNNTFENVINEANGVLKALTSLNSSSPPPPVETSKKLGNTTMEALVKDALAIIPERVDPEIANAFIDSAEQSTTLLSNLISEPEKYPSLSKNDKKLVTRIAIDDLKDISNKIIILLQTQ
jgi:hypothetical protein